MGLHWYIIANQTNAKIMQRRGLTGLSLIASLENPLGKERARNLRRKKPGVGLRSGGHGTVFRYTESSGENPRDEASEQFARKVAFYLKKGKEERSYDFLSIAAEPRFLGKMRGALDPRVSKSVVEWIESDFSKISDRELPEALDLENRVEPIM